MQVRHPKAEAPEGEREALDQFIEQNEASQPSPQAGADEGRPGGTNEPRDGTDSSQEAQNGQSAQSATPDSTANDASNNEGSEDNTNGTRSAGSPAGQEEAENPKSGEEGGSGQDSESEAPGNKGEETGQASSNQDTPQAEPGSEEQRTQSSLEQTGRQDEQEARGGSAGERSAAPNDGAEMPEDPQGSSSEQAGTSPGSDVESSRERLDAPQRTPEQLTGAQEDGPLSFAGEALKQGDAPDTLPQTGDPASYRQAAEEVIREGRIPLEYQEVIRDYFR